MIKGKKRRALNGSPFHFLQLPELADPVRSKIVKQISVYHERILTWRNSRRGRDPVERYTEYPGRTIPQFLYRDRHNILFSSARASPQISHSHNFRPPCIL